MYRDNQGRVDTRLAPLGLKTLTVGAERVKEGAAGCSRLRSSSRAPRTHEAEVDEPFQRR